MCRTHSARHLVSAPVIAIENCFHRRTSLSCICIVRAYASETPGPRMVFEWISIVSRRSAHARSCPTALAARIDVELFGCPRRFDDRQRDGSLPGPSGGVVPDDDQF